MGRKLLAYFAPGRIILFSILCTILMGTLLLSLPMCRAATIPLLDLFFTATSATCVTGLFTISLEQFTFWGQLIILILIQVGGLGVATLTLFLMYLFINLGLTTQLLAGQILEIDAWQNVKKILLFMVCLTISIELVGAFCIFLTIMNSYSLNNAIFLSIFHAISSFCNAGISLFNYEPHLLALTDNAALLGITNLLTFCGGLGFITWFEAFRYIGSHYQKRRYSFSLMSKIIFYGSITLIVIPTILIWILEHNNTFAHMGFFESWYNAACNAITLRSAGFLTVPTVYLHTATLLFMLAIAFIGTAPSSTGSGVRITTFAIFLTTVKMALIGQSTTNIKERRIPKEQVYKSVAIVSIGLFWIVSTIFLLLITESSLDFLDITVESLSAFTNLGISTGITSFLTSAGKLFIIVSMIVGRIGSLTLILAFRKARPHVSLEALQVTYPEERVMLS